MSRIRALIFEGIIQIPILDIFMIGENGIRVALEEKGFDI